MSKILERRVLLSGKPDIISGFPASVEKTSTGGHVFWYTAIGENEKFCGIGRAVETDDGGTFRREIFATRPTVVRRSSRPVIGNIPSGWSPVQPVRIALQGGGYRMWFWCHSAKDGVVRYLTAESEDDITYNCVDPLRPCLWHYCDRATVNKLPGVQGLAWNKDNVAKRLSGEPKSDPLLVCNDATTVYQLPDGSFECYSAAIRKVAKNSPEIIPWDNAAGYRRFIVRFTSRDGVHFEPCGPVVLPDELDAPYIQFYNLSVSYLKGGKRLGFISRYDVLAQTVDLELCRSNDGLTWERQHHPLFDRAPDELGNYATCNPVFDLNKKTAEIIYTSFNYIHNYKYIIGKKGKGTVRSVTLNAAELDF